MRSPTLAERIDALERAVTIAHGRFDDAKVGEASTVLDKVRARAGHGTDRTVIAVVGSTGVGKSSLFNALVGSTVSSTGVRRPTTSVAHASVWGDGDAALLDWLGVGRRHHVDAAADDPRAGLVLIDLPDFDSTNAANRDEVDRLVALVDVLVWVTDPQKYADEALHHGYVRPLAGYGDIMRFVLNKIDTVPEDRRSELVDDFRARLVDDGVTDPTVYVTSVADEVGVDAISAVIDEAVAARRSMVTRLETDLRSAALSLAANDGDGRGGLDKRDRREFVDRLGRAAGADAAGSVVAAQHRHDARAAMGWPPATLLTRWRRRHPIADLPRATGSSVAGSEVDLALRDVGEAAAGDLSSPWPRVLRDIALGHADALRPRLTAVTSEIARDAVGRPRWWGVVRALQQMLTIAVVVGAVWLLAAALLGGFLGFDTDPLLIDTPGAEWIPLPSLLVLGGLGLGFILSLLVRIPVGVAARRRGRRVRGALVRRVGQMADETVLADLDEALADRRRFGDLLATAAR